jgi:hypothetical protein
MTMTEAPPNSTPKAGRVENLTRMGVGKEPGTIHRTTKALKDAILLGAVMADARLNYKAVRNDPEATAEQKAAAKEAAAKADGALEGYCAWLAEHHPASFAPLLAKVLPIQIKSSGGPIDPASGPGVAELGQAIAFALRLGTVQKPQPKTINGTTNPTTQERKI